MAGFIGKDHWRHSHMRLHLLDSRRQRGGQHRLRFADGAHAQVNTKQILQQTVNQSFRQPIAAVRVPINASRPGPATRAPVPGGNKVRLWPAWPGWPPAWRPLLARGLGGLPFFWSVDGGRDELRELVWSFLSACASSSVCTRGAGWERSIFIPHQGRIAPIWFRLSRATCTTIAAGRYFCRSRSTKKSFQRGERVPSIFRIVANP